MSKIEITTDSKGVTHIRDPRTGKSEVIQLSQKAAKNSFQVDCDSNGVSAHILYREEPSKAA